MVRIGLFITFLLCTLQINAQEMWGVANSNYSGVLGHGLNPASIVGNPFKWELNMISLDASAMNNYVYLQKHSQAFRNMKGEGIGADRIKTNTSKSDKNANLNLNVMAPSFMSSHQMWGLGFHAATRMALSVHGIPYHIANFMKEGFDYTQQQNTDFTIDNMSMAAMNWNEAGLTGGLALIVRPESFLTAGVTLNYLYGMNAAYLNLDNFKYNVPSDTLWKIDLADINYGYAFSEKSGDLFQKKGSGYSTSLGLQYYRNRDPEAYNNCAKDNNVKKYDFKIGISIIDIGKINYNTNASSYKLNDVSANWYNIDTTNLSSFSNVDSALNSQFSVANMTSKTGSQFDIWMPAAASLQFDYACSPNFYLNFSAIQRLPMGEHAIKRANQLSVTARYELKRFEIAVPYSFYDYFRHRIGLSLRYSFLTVGTDMVGPYTGASNAYGLNFYIGIRWQHFESCMRKQRKEEKKKTAACYTDFK